MSKINIRRRGDSVTRWFHKGKIETVLLILLVIILAVPSRSFGFGLEVGPDEIYIENVSLGEPVAVSVLAGERMKLSIKNKGTSAYTYSIDILRTAQTTATLKEGYRDIPDISWIWPENKEVKIAGNSTKVVELYLKIPKKAGYANKRYQAVIEVKSKKNNPTEIFVLACQLKIFFTTKGDPVSRLGWKLFRREAKNARK